MFSFSRVLSASAPRYIRVFAALLALFVVGSFATPQLSADSSVVLANAVKIASDLDRDLERELRLLENPTYERTRSRLVVSAVEQRLQRLDREVSASFGVHPAEYADQRSTVQVRLEAVRAALPPVEDQNAPRTGETTIGTTTYSGRVIDSATKLPLSNAFVGIAPPDAHYYNAYGYTNSNGLFEISGVPAGEMTIDAVAEGYFVQSKTVTTPIFGRSENHAFELTQGGRISGRISAAEGLQPDWVDIKVQNVSTNTWWYAYVKDDGTYSTYTALPPGEYVVSVFDYYGSYGVIPQIWNGIDCNNGMCDPNMGTRIAITGTDHVSNIDFAIKRYGYISGTVQDASSLQPLSYARVELFDAQGSYAGSTYVYSSDPGAYRIGRGQTGTFYLKAYALSEHTPQLYRGLDCDSCDVKTGTPVTITAQSDVVTGIDFALNSAGGSISGTARGSDGKSIAYSSVRLYKDGAYFRSAAVDSQGRYRFNILPFGNYRLDASPGDLWAYYPEAYPNIRCAEWDCNQTSGSTLSITPQTFVHRDINFTFDRRPHIVVRAFYADTNLPVRGGNARAYSGGSLRAVAYESSTPGVYVVNVPEGDYQVEFAREGFLTTIYPSIYCSGPGCDPAAGTMVHVVADTPGDVSVTVMKGRKISGRVTNEVTGKPLSGYVSIHDALGRYIGRAVSSFDGEYEITGLASGNHYLIAEASEHARELYDGVPCSYATSCSPTSGVPVSVASNDVTGVNFSLRPIGGHVSGRIHDKLTGAPVSGITVTAVRAFLSWSGVSGPDGYYTIDRVLGPGDYRIKTSSYGRFVDELYGGIACWGYCSDGDGTVLKITETTNHLPAIDFALSRVGIRSIAPSMIALAGSSIRIHGRGFQAGATILVGGVPANVTFFSVDYLGVLAPARNEGLVSVEVRNPDGSVAVLQDAVSYSSVPARNARLVKDIDVRTNTMAWGSSFSSAYHAVNGDIYFTAPDYSAPSAGTHLWRTDGTASGTRQVSQTSGSFGWVKSLGDTILFWNSGLWRTLGTRETTTKIDVALPDRVGSQPARVGSAIVWSTVVNNKQELWRSDGTAEGTHAYATLPALNSYSTPALTLIENQDRAYFLWETDEYGREPWVTDGTPEGTKVIDLIPGHGSATIKALIAYEGSLYLFVADGTELAILKSDGSVAGTTLVKSFTTGIQSDLPNPIVTSHGLVFAFASTGLGRQPWITDGTSNGTRLIANVNLTDSRFDVAGDRLVFVGYGAGYEIRSVALSGAGDVQTIRSGPPQNLVSTGPVVYFTLPTQCSSPTTYAWCDEVYRSDGTPAGTKKVDGSSSLVDVGAFLPVGGALFFSAEHSAKGKDFWIIDSSSSAARLLRDAADRRTLSADPRKLIALGNQILFTSPMPNAYSFESLWRTDGSETGTTQILSQISAESPFARVKDKLLFAGSSANYGEELWVTDGRPEGTRMLVDLEPGSLSGFQFERRFYPFGDRVLINRRAYYGASELWITDGTSEGTTKLADIGVRASAVIGGVAYLATIDNGVWRTDGTAAGTFKISSQESSYVGTCGGQLLSSNGTLYSINTSTGTSTPIGWVDYPSQIFSSPSGTCFVITPSSLRTTDGMTLSQPLTTYSWSVPRDVQMHGTLLYFIAGSAFIVSDGTLAGTRKIASAEFAIATSAGVYYSGAVKGNDVELLRAGDGNSPSTLAAEINELDSARPAEFLEFGSELFFAADHHFAGRELFAYPLNVPCTPASVSISANAQTVPSGGDITLTANYSGTLPLQVRWFEGAPGDMSRPIEGGIYHLLTLRMTATRSVWARVTNGCGSFNSNGITLRVQVNQRAGGDLDGDGRADILWRHQSSGSNAAWTMDGSTVKQGYLLPAVGDTDMKIVMQDDVTGDGTADVIWWNARTGETAVWVMNGGQVAEGRYLPTVADTQMRPVGYGDFNGDSYADLLWRHQTTGQNVIWFFQSGYVAGGYLLPTVPDNAMKVAAVGDFDGDGRSDIFWRNSSNGENAVWLLQGAYVVSATMLPTVGVGMEIVASFDADADQRDDIMWRSTAGMNALWYMEGTTVNRGRYLPEVPDTAMMPAATGDFDGDGDIEIVWRNHTSGLNALWFLTDDTVAGAFLPSVDDGQWRIVGPK